MSSRWINVAMSLLIAGAGLLGRGAERTSNLGVGFAIFLVAFIAMGSAAIRRLNTALGAWAALSPFFLAYRDPIPGWTAVAAGLVVIVASLWPDPPPRLVRSVRSYPRTA